MASTRASSRKENLDSEKVSEAGSEESKILSVLERLWTKLEETNVAMQALKIQSGEEIANLRAEMRGNQSRDALKDQEVASDIPKEVDIEASMNRSDLKHEILDVFKIMNTVKNIEIPDLDSIKPEDIQKFIRNVQKFRRIHGYKDQTRVQDSMVNQDLIKLIAATVRMDIDIVKNCREEEFLQILRRCTSTSSLNHLEISLKKVNMKGEKLHHWFDYVKEFTFIVDSNPVGVEEQKWIMKIFCEGIRPVSLAKEVAKRRPFTIEAASDFYLMEYQIMEDAIDRGYVKMGGGSSTVRANAAKIDAKAEKKKTEKENPSKKAADSTLEKTCWECASTHSCWKCPTYQDKVKKNLNYKPEKMPEEAHKKAVAYRKKKATKKEKHNLVVTDLDEDEDEVYICYEIASVSVCDTGIFLDSGATNHFIKDRSLLKDVENCQDVKVQGISGKVVVNEKGFMSEFGQCYYMPTGNLNIISMGKLQKDGYNIRTENEGILVSKNEDNYFFRLNKEKLYCLDTEYSNEAVEMIISEGQRERSRKVLELQAALGFPSDLYLKRALDHGTIAGCDLTTKDLEIARKLFGPLPEKYIGKMTEVSSSKNNAPNNEIVGSKLHCDLMFLRGALGGWIFLVAVDDATGYIVIEELSDQKEVTLVNALKRVVGIYKSYNHYVKEIVSDSGSNFVAAEVKMNIAGIRSIIRPTGTHAKIAERAIRKIKDTARSMLASLEYQLPGFLYGELVMEASKNCNYVPNSKTITRSPFEIIDWKEV